MRLRELRRHLLARTANAASCSRGTLTGIQAIEKAIQKANLGLSPVVQGKIIRTFRFLN